LFPRYQRATADPAGKLKISLPMREVDVKRPGMIFKGNPRNNLTQIQLPIGS
jgi:hypothetical protein